VNGNAVAPIGVVVEEAPPPLPVLVEVPRPSESPPAREHFFVRKRDGVLSLDLIHGHAVAVLHRSLL
jgi:hypothetical protein